MRSPIIYLESSVFGFYDDERLENRGKMLSTRKLFKEIKKGFFQSLTSPLAIKEISRAPTPIKEKLLALVKDYSIEVVEADEAELESLVTNYLEEKIVPEAFKNDARHVAYATILRVDILVSLNLAHLANEWSARRFNAVNLKEGYPELIIRLPEEVIHYGD